MEFFVSVQAFFFIQLFEKVSIVYSSKCMIKITSLTRGAAKNGIKRHVFMSYVEKNKIEIQKCLKRLVFIFLFHFHTRD